MFFKWVETTNYLFTMGKRKPNFGRNFWRSPVEVGSLYPLKNRVCIPRDYNYTVGGGNSSIFLFFDPYLGCHDPI